MFFLDESHILTQCCDWWLGTGEGDMWHADLIGKVCVCVCVWVRMLVHAFRVRAVKSSILVIELIKLLFTHGPPTQVSSPSLAN